MSDRPLALTVVIMAYNEVDTLEKTCLEILGVVDQTGIDAELLLIDDGSTDGSESLADDLQTRERRICVIHHSPNQGLGGVYRTGFDRARGTFVTFFPADGQFPASIIADFLPRMAAHDMVLGFLAPGTRPFFAEALSGVERLIYGILLGPMPRFQGIVMFRRELLARHQLRSTGRGWAILMELVVRCSQGSERMVSVPTPVRPRTHGSSKVNNVRTIWSNLRQVLMLRNLLREHPRA